MIPAASVQPCRPTRRRRAAGAVTTAVVLLALVSCAASPALDADGDTVTPATPATDAAGPVTTSALPEDPALPATPPATTPAAAPAPSPEDDLAAVSGAVDSALRTLAGSRDSVTSDQVRGAIAEGFSAAGAVAESVEVSIDRTPTGLDVDAIQGAGLTGGRCVFGEVRAGVVSVVVLPALSSGQCFVGDQR
ncbi:DUF6993 domain-containing protein [Arthrobacter sp. MDT1-65]